MTITDFPIRFTHDHGPRLQQRVIKTLRPPFLARTLVDCLVSLLGHVVVMQASHGVNERLGRLCEEQLLVHVPQTGMGYARNAARFPCRDTPAPIYGEGAFGSEVTHTTLPDIVSTSLIASRNRSSNTASSKSSELVPA